MNTVNFSRERAKVCLLLSMAVTIIAPTSPAFSQTQNSAHSLAAPGFRQIPYGAPVGRMVGLQGNMVDVNGSRWQLSPGATIRDERNLLVLSDRALATAQTVRYTTSPQGHIQQVWILSEAESSAQALEAGGAQKPSYLRSLGQSLGLID